MVNATQSQDSNRYGEFQVTVSDRNPGMLAPMIMGRIMWRPMFFIGIISFPTLIALGAVRAALIDSGDSPETVAVLGQVLPGVFFLGMMGALTGIVFAIARILGAFRDGGGGVQEATGRRVVMLAMPMTARGMIVLMLSGMMMVLFSVISQFVMAAVVDAPPSSTIQSWATWQEGLRRFAAVVYLTGIALGLATIVTVIRFQSKRIREIGDEELISR